MAAMMCSTSDRDGFLKRGLLGASYGDLVLSDPLDEALYSLFARYGLTGAVVARNYDRVGLFLRGNILERHADAVQYRFTCSIFGIHERTSRLASRMAWRERHQSRKLCLGTGRRSRMAVHLPIGPGSVSITPPCRNGNCPSWASR